MAILFIADLHLSTKDPHISECFFNFLKNEAIKAEALYILGDLFEFWIGDDDPTPLYHDVAEKLFKVSLHGVRIYFIHGNRDFMLGEKYALKAGMQILPEVHPIDLYGVNTIIMHGDTLCTKDIAYQNYRKKVHNKKLQWIFNHLPLWLRQKIGNKIRNTSQENTPQKNQEITDVVQDAVEQAMISSNSTRLIHGHTHKPNVHKFSLFNDGEEKTVERIVLGDWYHQGSVLICDEQGCRLESLTQ